MATAASAQDSDAVAEMARKAQDPLADVKAFMTDNAINFKGGPDDDVTFNLQAQPVYSIPNESNWNIIGRAIIPLIGIEPGVVYPPVGTDPAPNDGSTWGLSDTYLQAFFSPKKSGNWKWGVGPQVSLLTSTSHRVRGPGWGAGLAGVLFGSVGNWSLGGVASQHWGGNNFNLATVQVIAMYNFADIPGLYAGYNNSITYDWSASSGESLTLPLGAMVGRTFLVQNGDGLDLNIGLYSMVERPTDSPKTQLRFGISYFFN